MSVSESDWLGLGVYTDIGLLGLAGLVGRDALSVTEVGSIGASSLTTSLNSSRSRIESAVGTDSVGLCRAGRGDLLALTAALLRGRLSSGSPVRGRAS